MKKIFLLIISMTVAAACLAADVNKVLENLKSQIASDKRVAIWDVKAVKKGGLAVIDGMVGFQEQKDAIGEVLKENNIKFKNNVKVLASSIDSMHQWALAKLSVSTLRCEPKHSAEVATQVVMGTPLRVIEKSGDWYRVQCPDNYIAYVPESSLKFVSQSQLDTWKRADRYIFIDYDGRLVTEPGGDETVTDLVLGCILEIKRVDGEWMLLSTPDGREGWTPAATVEGFASWAKQDIDLKKIEKTAKRMMGSGYMWGGTSTKVTDCSGLVKVSYFSNGIILQRDASQQALTGLKIKDWHDAQLCDLLFFGNSKTGRVTHVGLYLADGKYIHCSGRVKVNDLNPSAPDYLYSPLSISRINGQIGTKGIIYARDHRWFFEKK